MKLTSPFPAVKKRTKKEAENAEELRKLRAFYELILMDLKREKDVLHLRSGYGLLEARAIIQWVEQRAEVLAA